MQKNTAVENQPSVSGKQLGKPKEPVTSENLLKHVSLQLYSMMVEVTKDAINPNTVNAACNCASEIHKLLKFNQEVMRKR